VNVVRLQRLLWFGVGGGAAGLLAGTSYFLLAAAFDVFPAVFRLGGANGQLLGAAWHLALSAAIGIAYAWLFHPGAESRLESMMNGAAYGLLWWIALSLNFVPILLGEGPHWQAADAARALPDLIGYIFNGVLLGLGYQLFLDWTASWPALREEPHAGAEAPFEAQRIVIVGGEFAGVATAERLERLLERDRSATLTLMPILLGGEVQWSLGAVAAAYPSLVGHLAYGGTTALIYQLLARRYDPGLRPGTRARRERHRRTAGTPAPALWVVVLTLGTLLPLVLADNGGVGPSPGADQDTYSSRPSFSGSNPCLPRGQDTRAGYGQP
jgi:hypothetical protein